MVRWSEAELRIFQARKAVPTRRVTPRGRVRPAVTRCDETGLDFTVPIRIDSELNLPGHWRGRWARFAEHRQAVELGWPRVDGVPARLEAPAVVTLTRLAPKRILDEHDNLRSGFKGAVDAIAGMLGLDDGDSRITWEYRQETSKAYGVRITVERTSGSY